MLKIAGERTKGILQDPPPFVLQKTLGDFAVTYELNVFTDAPHNMVRLYTELHRNILDVFNEFGVQIMTPAYEEDPTQPKIVPRDQWFVPRQLRTTKEVKRRRQLVEDRPPAVVALVRDGAVTRHGELCGPLRAIFPRVDAERRRAGGKRLLVLSNGN